jgi:3-oxoacyl-[acyl-carrier protein] reductase
VTGLGPLSVVINAAGISKDGLCVRMSTEQVRQILDVNLLGTIRVCKALVPTLMRQRQGRFHDNLA